MPNQGRRCKINSGRAYAMTPSTVSTPDGIRITIHVIPNAKETKMLLERDGSITMRVHAPPVNGKEPRDHKMAVQETGKAELSAPYRRRHAFKNENSGDHRNPRRRFLGNNRVKRNSRSDTHKSTVQILTPAPRDPTTVQIRPHNSETRDSSNPSRKSRE